MDDVSAPTIRTFSCGAGVQSTAIALLMRDGKLPLVDHVIFADTGFEPAQVYRQVERLEVVFAELGSQLHRVSNGNIRTDPTDPEMRFATPPWFVRNPDGSEGMGRRQCTSEYKLVPISRKIRELLGAKPPKFRSVPKGRVAENMIGFSTDEIGRVSDKTGVQYERLRYPLLELGMSRRDCTRYLERAGWGDTAKSACIACPFHGNRAWRELRDQRPDEWARAVEFDAAIRKGGARGEPLNGEAFLHRSRIPLSIAPIDRWTRGDKAEAQAEIQGDLFDELEDGDPDGCSPYGCRSGSAA